MKPICANATLPPKDTQTHVIHRLRARTNHTPAPHPAPSRPCRPAAATRGEGCRRLRPAPPPSSRPPSSPRQGPFPTHPPAHPRRGRAFPGAGAPRRRAAAGVRRTWDAGLRVLQREQRGEMGSPSRASSSPCRDIEFRISNTPRETGSPSRASSSPCPNRRQERPAPDGPTGPSRAAPSSVSMPRGARHRARGRQRDPVGPMLTSPGGASYRPTDPPPPPPPLPRRRRRKGWGK